MDAAKRKATYTDLEAQPADVRAEIVAGVLTTSPAPLPRHSRAQRSMSRFIGGPFDDDDQRGGPGGWWILLEVDIGFGPHDIVRPDLAGWQRERLPDPWDRRPIEVRPDWVCEITSPSTAARDRVTKRRLYAQHRVPYYWLIDPQQRTLEALKLVDDHWLELGSWGDDETAHIDPFAAIELEISRLFVPR